MMKVMNGRGGLLHSVWNTKEEWMGEGGMKSRGARVFTRGAFSYQEPHLASALLEMSAQFS